MKLNSTSAAAAAVALALTALVGCNEPGGTMQGDASSDAADTVATATNPAVTGQPQAGTLAPSGDAETYTSGDVMDDEPSAGAMQDRTDGTTGTTSRASDQAVPPGDPAGDRAATPAAGKPLPGGQAEALSLLSTINAHEISTAEQARSKNLSGPVAEYANLMHQEHTKNQQKTQSLLGMGKKADDSAAVKAQRQKGEAERARLAALEGDAYAKAYIAAMVKDHQAALDAIDRQMLPAAKDANVREHLRMTREAVAKHLEHARRLAQR